MARFQNACKRTLIFVLLTLGTIFFVPVSALANGVITVTTPLNDATVTVPFDVHFTYSGTDTYTKLWIDGVAIISDHNGSVFDYTVTSLAAGQHVLALQAHDATSNTTVTLDETITVSSTPLTTVTVTPSPETVLEGNQYTFNSNVNATWKVSGDGTIPTCTSAAMSCTFVAGPTTGTATLTATATDGSGATGQANITISSLVLSPASITVVAGETQTYSSTPSSVPVTYSANPATLGSFSGNTFTAANTTGLGTVLAAATDGSGATGATPISVVPLAITPSNPSVAEGQTQTFTANAPVSWSVSGDGTLVTPCATTSCVFTANTTGTQAVVTAAETSTAALQIQATVTLGPLTITPGEPPASPATTVENQTQVFTANAPIPSGNWSASCGQISATTGTSATFTAPSSIPSPNPCTISASDSGGASVTAYDTITDPPPPSGLNYTTWKYDNGRTGLNAHETTLTAANVNSKTFGLKFTDAVDGQLFAQPLYLSNVTINGAVHNVVYVATEHDTVYAFDADVEGPPLWQKSLILNGGSSVPAANVQSTISTEVGITGTPVIDISAGVNNGVLYVVAQTLEGGKYITRLHGLNVTSGNDISGSPVVVSGTYQGTAFSAEAQLNRPALLWSGGNVYLAFGPSDGDRPGVNVSWHGWLFGYNATTFEPVGLWCSTPTNDGKGGIWGGGGGIAGDSEGNVYAATGNGNWNGTSEFAMSWVKFDPSVTLQDYFTPYNEATMSNNDWDLGSGGILVVPDGTSSQFPRELLGCGKPAPIYVVDRDDMGHLNPGSDSQIIQSLANVVGGGSGTHTNDHCFSTPAYWNGNLYFVGNADVVRMFKLDSTTGKVAATPSSKGPYSYGFPGGQPVVSANGASGGVVWVLDYTSYDLHAYDATNVSNELYRSSSVGAMKWTVPTVINGKVYVGSKGKLSVFGLF
jgi:hypothetical protein